MYLFSIFLYSLPRDQQPGDRAPYAHQNVREFPDWYKPYGFNYDGHGWLVFILAGFAVGGYSYLNDIKEEKGRKSRKVYPIFRDGVKTWNDNRTYFWARDRIEKGDPNWVKYTVHKPRAAAHH